MKSIDRGGRVLLGAIVLTLCAEPAFAQEDLTLHAELPSNSGPAEEDHTLFNVALGVTGNGGNTRAVSGNGGLTLMVKRNRHEFSLDGLGTLGYAAIDDASGAMSDAGLEKNVGNVVGRIRYDYFLSDRDSLFVALVPRRDLFAGLKVRIQAQAGYMRDLYEEGEDHRFWAELGGDVTVDRYGPVEQDDGTEITSPDQEIYSVRMFAGYTNRLSSAAEINLGVEALVPPYDKKGEDGSYRYRINSNAELNSSLTDRFKLGFALRVFYDSSPPLGLKKFDTITALQLVYSYDSLAEKAEEPACPPCEGEAGDADAAPEAAAAPEPAAEAAAAAGAAAAPYAEAAGAPPPPPVEATVAPAEVPTPSPEPGEAPTADADPTPAQPATGGQ